MIRAGKAIILRYQSVLLRNNEQLRGLCNAAASAPLANQSAITASEVNHHAQMAKDWWNPDGVLVALHALNQIRVPFIRDGIVSRGNIDTNLVNTTRVLRDQKILEVGCGGGILSERLARLGATVTGIDLGEDVIKAAQKHLEEHSTDLIDNLSYKIEPIEVHAKDHCNYYDAVVLSELIEHVDNKPALLTNCVQTVKPGGSVFITTINKTLPMWFGGILLGENVLHLAPRGTHHWEQMISPVDVQRILDTLDCQTVLVNGSTYDFWCNNWRWINSTAMCYALHAVKAA